MTEVKRDSMMVRVQKLIDKANSTSFEPERDALMKKADALMGKWQIEQFELEFAKDNLNSPRKPIMKKFEYPRTGDLDADAELYRIFYDLASLTGVLIGHFGLFQSKVVGYEEDIAYLEMLMSGIVLHFALQVNPTPQDNLTHEENIALLKNAGFKWQEIYRMLVQWNPDHPKLRLAAYENCKDPYGYYFTAPDGSQFLTQYPKKGVGSWMFNAYKKWCRMNGHTPVDSNPETFRRSFRNGYVMTLKYRIQEMKQLREESSSGKELVLDSMRDRLKEALYEFFPEQRPHPEGCECDPCHRRTCDDRSGCSRSVCAEMRKPVRNQYRTRTFHEKKLDLAAYSAGQKAARNADLTGGRRNMDSAKAGEIGG